VPSSGRARSWLRRDPNRPAQLGGGLRGERQAKHPIGRHLPVATNHTTRDTIVSVLPEPAPATTTAGASGAVITASCSAVGGGRPSAAASSPR